MDSTEVLRAFLPDWLFDYFDIVQLDNQDARLDIYLDERKVIPLEYKDQPISAYGFTGACTVQDFPIRGKEVYLHLRRRKWLLLESREIVSSQHNIAYEGTKLTADFVAFFKSYELNQSLSVSPLSPDFMVFVANNLTISIKSLFLRTEIRISLLMLINMCFSRKIWESSLVLMKLVCLKENFILL